MGFSEKQQAVDIAAALDSEPTAKKWVIAGIPLRAPLKPIYTTTTTTNPSRITGRDRHDGGGDNGAEEGECSPTTPTGEESRIPTRLTCPPAPRKRKASLKCNYGVVREFFTPPDLETVFIRHVERAN